MIRIVVITTQMTMREKMAWKIITSLFLLNNLSFNAMHTLGCN
jgi:hypothetical protein